MLLFVRSAQLILRSSAPTIHDLDEVSFTFKYAEIGSLGMLAGSAAEMLPVSLSLPPVTPNPLPSIMSALSSSVFGDGGNQHCVTASGRTAGGTT